MTDIVQNPFSFYPDFNRGGRATYNGKIYVGTPDTNPRIPANQVRVFFIDENDQEVNLQQPVRTSVAGIPVNSIGDEIVLLADTITNLFSMAVDDRSDNQVFYIPNASKIGLPNPDDSSSLKNAVTNLQLNFGQKLVTSSFYEDKTYGGIEYTIEEEPAISHMTLTDGKVFIAIGAVQAWDGTQANINDLLNWTPDSSTGCLSFDITNHDLTHFGAIKDDITKDNIIAAQKSGDVIGGVIFPVSETPVYISNAINVTGKFDFNVSSRNRFRNTFNSATPLSDQDYLSKVYAPNGLLHNVYNASSNTARCREYIDSVMVYGDKTSGSIALKGRAANNINNCLFVNFEKIIENDFAFLSDIRNSRFDITDWFAHIATANEFNIDNCWFGSRTARVIDMEGLTLGVGAVSTGYPMSITRSNINCGSNTQFIARTRGGFSFGKNYVECFSAIAGESLFEAQLGRFDNGYFNLDRGNEINAQNNAENLVRFYGNNTAGTQNARANIAAENRIFGFTSSTPVIVGYVSNSFPSASTEVYNVTVDYPIGVNRRGNFNNYEGNIYCASGTIVDFSGASFVTLPLVVSEPTESTDAVSSNTWTKRPAGKYEIEVEVNVRSDTSIRVMELGIYLNGSQQSRVRESIVVDSNEAGDYYSTVTIRAVINLARGDDVQVRARQGGEAILTKMIARRIDF